MIKSVNVKKTGYKNLNYSLRCNLNSPCCSAVIQSLQQSLPVFQIIYDLYGEDGVTLVLSHPIQAQPDVISGHFVRVENYSNSDTPSSLVYIRHVPSRDDKAVQTDGSAKHIVTQSTHSTQTTRIRGDEKRVVKTTDFLSLNNVRAVSQEDLKLMTAKKRAVYHSLMRIFKRKRNTSTKPSSNNTKEDTHDKERKRTVHKSGKKSHQGLGYSEVSHQCESLDKVNSVKVPNKIKFCKQLYNSELDQASCSQWKAIDEVKETNEPTHDVTAKNKRIKRRIAKTAMRIGQCAVSGDCSGWKEKSQAYDPGDLYLKVAENVLLRKIDENRLNVDVVCAARLLTTCRGDRNNSVDMRNRHHANITLMQNNILLKTPDGKIPVRVIYERLLSKFGITDDYVKTITPSFLSHADNVMKFSTMGVDHTHIYCDHQ